MPCSVHFYLFWEGLHSSAPGAHTVPHSHPEDGLWGSSGAPVADYSLTCPLPPHRDTASYGGVQTARSWGKNLEFEAQLHCSVLPHLQTKS